MRQALFQQGSFNLNSGQHSKWKIECDSLTEDDWRTIAYMISERCEPFKQVYGIPRGGIPLAREMEKYVDPRSQKTLVVDDVLTTGGSMLRQMKIGRDIGWVAFARGPVPYGIKALFKLNDPLDDQQTDITKWVISRFGISVLGSVHERVARVLEEAIELAQSEGMSKLEVLGLIDHVFSKARGAPFQEAGGVGVTLAAYAESKMWKLSDVIAAEVARIHSLPPDYFHKRQQAKADAGVAMEPRPAFDNGSYRDDGASRAD